MQLVFLAAVVLFVLFFFSTITRPRKPKQQKVAGEKKAKDS